MEHNAHSRLFYRRPRRFDHAWLGIKPGAACHEWSEANRQRSWATTDVQQGFIPAESKPFSNRPEEFRAIRLTTARIKLDS